MPTFRNLPKRQAEVLGEIATNNAAGHPQSTLDALLRKGLIEREDMTEGMFTIHRYFVPLQIHYEWCLWCAENVADEEDAPDAVRGEEA